MRTYSDGPIANKAALDWIEDQLKGLPLDIVRLERNGHPSLIATTSAVTNRYNPRLWLAAHLDVVPSEPSLFVPQIKDGKLYGRGAYDMKYAIAIFIALLQDYGEELASMDIGLMITSDEEIAGNDGVGWLVEQGYRGQAIILPECGKSWTFESGAKGITWWDITSQGLPGHASRPWEGENAITNLTRYIGIVQQAFTPEPCGDRFHLHNTLNVGIIQGGTVANQIPGTATARLDIRLAPGTSATDMGNLLEQIGLEVPGISIARQLAVEPYGLRNDEPTRLFSSVVKDVTGSKPPRVLSHGISDARYFAKYGVPVICMPPVGGGQHSAREWVEIASLAKYYAILKEFIKQWL
jgi:succinyl-diaminopimelate desuccinylase